MGNRSFPKRAVFVIGAVLILSLVLVSTGTAGKIFQFPARFQEIIESSSKDANNAEAKYVFVTQPWGWVSGIADPGASLQGQLSRGGGTFANASTTAGSDGYFAFDFKANDTHVNLIAGDQVQVTGGGLDATVLVVTIEGEINAENDTVIGQVVGGSVPSTGSVRVGLPALNEFKALNIAFGDEGQYVADFSGAADIEMGSIAQVAFKDAAGNAVIQVLFPEGISARVFTSEGKVEGVAMPGTPVGIEVTRGSEVVGTASVEANAVGFFSAPILNAAGHPIRFALNDHVKIVKAGQTQETDLTFYHESYVLPWSGRVVGKVYGVPLPADGSQGRLEIWSADQDRWYSVYMGIGADGSFGVDTSGLVQLSEADFIRVSAVDQNHVEQSVMGWGLNIGASTTDHTVWGYTLANSEVNITLYRGLQNNQPVDELGTAVVHADALGYFKTQITNGSNVLSISPGNVVSVTAGEHQKQLFIGQIAMRGDFDDNCLELTGTPLATVHLEGRRAGVIREDAPYQNEYFWREIVLDSSGKGQVCVGSFQLTEGDWVDVTYYGINDSVAFHALLAVSEIQKVEMRLFLPMLSN